MEFGIEKLPIIVNGQEKFATGLNRSTTLDDIKYAMLSVTEPEFNMTMLDDYALFEKWQGNERILDGRIRIHKLLKMWQSVPGNQLAHVQFVIKKKIQPTHKLQVRDANVRTESKFAFCALSPDSNKKWNEERVNKRMKNKSWYVQRQLAMLQQNQSSSEDESDENVKRYASIKRTNQSKTSTIKKINNNDHLKQDFIELVKKQSEIIEKQLFSLNEENEELLKSKKQPISSRLAHSLIRTSKKIMHSMDANQKQQDEMKSMTDALEQMDDIITLKTKYIESLENELRVLDEIDENIVDDQQMLLPCDSKKTSTSSLFSLISNLSLKNTKWENDSDTGISSAGSELETLV